MNIQSMTKRLCLALAVSAMPFAALPSAALAKDVSFMCFPNAQSLPLFVLQAKAAEFLPQGTRITIAHPQHNPKAIAAFLQQKQVNFASMNHALGAKLHAKGMSHLKLAGVHVWGGVGILSKIQIKPGDWAALKGREGLAVPGLMSPSHKMSMMAMKVNGIKPKQDIIMAGTSPRNAFQQMKSKATAPDFITIPEPQLSHGLLVMEQQNWEQKYHLFADSITSITDFGIPIGSLWLVNETPDTAMILNGFERAVAYTMDPANRAEVAQIIAAGFKTTFGKDAPPKVFENALKRGLLKMRFKDAAAIERKLRMVWNNMGLAPGGDVLYRGRGYKVPAAAFLISSTLPRHVGVALAHGNELKLSGKTMMAALKIRLDVHKVMIGQMSKLRRLEFAILEAYQNEDWPQIETLLSQLADLKLETSKIQIQCIKRTIEKFDAADVKKIKAYYAGNKNMIANYGGF